LKILFGICQIETKFPFATPYFSSLGVPV